MIHKLYRSKESDKFFPGIQSFVNCIHKQRADSEVSNVVYVEIISEKVDSKQTLLGVIGHLQTTFVKGQGLKYVIVCEDGKTYTILQEIKNIRVIYSGYCRFQVAGIYCLIIKRH